jgi:AcrR family transcriptional regulator
MSAPAVAAAKPSSSKRDHLLLTAWRLFYDRGYHAVGIDTILAEAGVAKMTLYHHFASKDDLIVAVLEWRRIEFNASLDGALAKAAPSPRKQILAAFDWLREYFESPGFNGCAFIRAVAEYPHADERPHQVAAAHKQGIIDRFTRLAKEAGARDAVVVGRQLALLMEGAIITAHTFGASKAAKDAKAAAEQLL